MALNMRFPLRSAALAVYPFAFIFFFFSFWKQRDFFTFSWCFQRTIKDFKSCILFLLLFWFGGLSCSGEWMLAVVDCSLWAHIDTDRNVVARGQPICSCSIIDAMVHSLPPFLAFILSLDAHAGWVAEDTVQTTAAVWRRVCMRLHGPATHTLFHLKHSRCFLDTQLTQRAASLSSRTHCTAAVTRPQAPDQLSGLSHAAYSHCAEQPFRKSSLKLKPLLRVSVNILGRLIWSNV